MKRTSENTEYTHKSAKKIKKNIKIGKNKLMEYYEWLKDKHKEIKDEYKLVAYEMEAFALFANAKALGKEAACLATVSDSRFKEGQNLSSADRQNAFDDMMVLALTAAIAVVG